MADELSDRGFARRRSTRPRPGAREQALRAFRTARSTCWWRTAVAARIDVEDVTHVITKCPEDEKTYLHGRATGRAGNTGTAITFVDWDDRTAGR